MDLEQMAALADEYNGTRKARLELNREAKVLQDEETLLKLQLIAEMKEAKSRGIGGQTCTIELKIQQEPTVEDWDLVRAYIVENNAWDCMNKALNAKAIKIRAEDDVVVPGIAWFPVEKLSVHQLKDNE